MARTWSEVPVADLMAWNRPVWDAAATLWQLPFWRAFLERPGLHARYFAERDTGHDTGDRPLAWACVLEWGPRSHRVALVQDGPVHLADSGGPVPPESARALCEALRRHGYVFVRFCAPADTLSPVRDLPGAVAGDLFPFFSHDIAELHVRFAGVERTLAGFQRHARYQIGRAERQGYRVRSGGEELLDPVHRIIRATALRKGFRVPSRDTLADLVRTGAAVGGVRLYLAESADGHPVSAIVIGADRSTWHYLFGGVDPDRTAKVSPTTLLHWTAMRQAMAAGAAAYNLGAAAPPSIAAFKERFCPVRTAPPHTVTIGLRPVPTAVWRWAVLPALTRAWPSAQRVRHRLWRRHETDTRIAAGAA